MTAPARFYQDDVTRLLKAYIAAGCPAPQIIVDPDGKITATPYSPEKSVHAATHNPWDDDLKG